MDLDECIRNGFIKKTRIDKELIKSLIEMSDTNENTVNTAKINNANISSYVSLAYESLRQILEAICISKGYKILSHQCIGEFLLKENIDMFNYKYFDRFRWIRNSINYYGKKVDYDQGKELINKIFEFKKRLKDHLINK